MNDYMGRKLSSSQKLQLRNGHKQKVFNPNPTPETFTVQSTSSQRPQRATQNTRISLAESDSSSEMDVDN